MNCEIFTFDRNGEVWVFDPDNRNLCAVFRNNACAVISLGGIIAIGNLVAESSEFVTSLGDGISAARMEPFSRTLRVDKEYLHAKG